MQNYPVTANFQIVDRPYEFTQEQVEKLCRMQDELNTYIHPDWKSQEFNWGLAIQDEIMEIHGHLGWKWWKGDYLIGLTAENLRQVQLEVIDILHFVLSEVVEVYLSVTEAKTRLNGRNNHINSESLIKFLIYMEDQKDYGGDILETWADLARFVGLSEQDIMETYTQKYVLNKFRQDHGYKTGEYSKIWIIPTEIDGVKMEDNEVLAMIVDSIKTNEGQDTCDEIELYSRLEYWYNSRLNQ